MSVEELKQQGNEYFKNKQYDLAIQKYTEAINVDSSNHILYSNRSACYCALSQFDLALQDAKESTKILPTFAKGYARKAAALKGKNSFSQAASAYMMAADFEENDSVKASYFNEAKECEQEDRYQRGVEQRPANTYRPTASSTSSSNQTSSYEQRASLFDYCVGDMVRIQITLQFILRFFAFLNFGLVFVPVANVMIPAYRQALIALILNFSYQLFQIHGRPQFNVQWAGPFIQDYRCSRFMIAMLFYSSAPSPLPLVLLLLSEIGPMFQYIYGFLKHSMPSLADRGAGFVNTSIYLARFTETDITSWENDASSRWPKFNRAVNINAGRMEIVLGIASIIGIPLQQTNIMTAIVYWQLIKIRYMVSPETQQGFREFDTFITSNIQSYPTVYNGYSKLRQYLATQVDPQQQAAQQPSMPRCTIM